MLNETLTHTTDTVRDRLRELAAEGLDRSPDFVPANASEAVKSARTWVDGAVDHSAEWLDDDHHRRTAGRWIAITIAGSVVVLGTIFLVRRIRARGRRRREQRAVAEVRNLIESNAPDAPTEGNRRSDRRGSDRRGTGSRAAS